MYIREMIVRYRGRHVRTAGSVPQDITKATDAATVLVPLLQREVVEVAVVLCLSTKLELLAYHTLARGTLDGSIVHPRDVFRTALLTNASAIVVGHNHPSGHPEPSSDDLALTKRLLHASWLMGVTLQDHLIVASDGRWFSFVQAALL